MQHRTPCGDASGRTDAAEAAEPGNARSRDLVEVTGRHKRPRCRSESRLTRQALVLVVLMTAFSPANARQVRGLYFGLVCFDFGLVWFGMVGWARFSDLRLVQPSSNYARTFLL